MTNSTSTSSFWKSMSMLLFGLVFAQWCLFLSVLESKHPQSTANPADTSLNTISGGSQMISPHRNGEVSRSSNTNTTTVTRIVPDILYEGVAVTVMLRAPKWFHRRYTVMLHNVMANIPSTWPIQVFSNEDWLANEVLPLHPGLRALRSNPRILWTPLPTQLTRRQTKPKEIMKALWLWNQVVSENVILFSGNGAFCGNAKTTVHEFLDYDYVGVPWGRFDGQGGDGSTHSFRHRSAMIQILKEHPPDSEMDTPDHQYFVKHLLEASDAFHVGDKDTTNAFGGIYDPESSPLVVSGTQANLNWTSREALLTVCPELRMIFPSLHEPACFGAHPNGAKCKASICALQDSIPSQGC